ncbi:L-type lectin-domain containing receptor kinase IX.1 [Ancistrocladus abbreviatus]
MSAECQKGLLKCVWDLYSQGRLLSALDERLQMNYKEKQVECLMVVGLWCAHPDCHLRPSIRQAIQVLNFEAPMPTLPPKMPVATYLVPSQSASTSEPSLTITILESGR